mmetsp:Transcript_6828/g.14052  ORF Transcript_6828/g.14052 Transcript_6828/m.14052 type:complete len:254 (+) Transcript_6828:1155-1916(+)
MAAAAANREFATGGGGPRGAGAGAGGALARSASAAAAKRELTTGGGGPRGALYGSSRRRSLRRSSPRPRSSSANFENRELATGGGPAGVERRSLFGSRRMPEAPPLGAAPNAAALELLGGSLLSKVDKFDNFSVGGALLPPPVAAPPAPRAFKFKRGRSPEGREAEAPPPPLQLSPPPPPPPLPLRQPSPRRPPPPPLARGGPSSRDDEGPAARLRQLPESLAMFVVDFLFFVDYNKRYGCCLFSGVWFVYTP